MHFVFSADYISILDMGAVAYSSTPVDLVIVQFHTSLDHWGYNKNLKKPIHVIRKENLLRLYFCIFANNCIKCFN